MEDKRIAVLLSSYNGAKYIEEQVESILNQSYKNFTLFIRDDNSKDETLSVLKKYSQNPKIVFLPCEKNLGYPECFYEMLRSVTGYDYYSFSDQDDVWNPDKLERAITILNTGDCEKPCLVFTNYDVVDESLNFIRRSVGPSENPDFNYSLFSSIGLGFTYVINNTLKELLLEKRSVKTVTKDAWIGMLACAFGTAYYDSASTALHRRNDGAFSPQDRTFFQTQKDRFKKYFKTDGFKYIKDVMDEFYEMFYDALSEKDKKIMSRFVNRKKDPVTVFKKVFYPHRLRYDIKDEIMLRAIFLLGKL